MGYAIRTKDFRYVQWVNSQSKTIIAEELYDHRSDQQEMINVAQQKQYSAKVKELAKLLNSETITSLPKDWKDARKLLELEG